MRTSFPALFTARAAGVAALGLLTCALTGCPAPANNDAGAEAGVADVVNTDAVSPEGGVCAMPGGAVTGAADMHCVGDAGAIVQTVDPATCHPDAGPPADAARDDGGAMTSDYGDTLFSGAGADDDCKYNVSWTATPVCQGSDVFFTVTATSRVAGNAPVRMAAVRAEVFLSETHPAPNTAQTVTETAPGVYRVGPIRFDATGRWTARFHFFEDCDDGDESPHGHAAFFVNVP